MVWLWSGATFSPGSRPRAVRVRSQARSPRGEDATGNRHSRPSESAREAQATTITTTMAPSKAKRSSSSSGSAYLLMTAFLSGIVCYRLGMFSGCASPWLSNIQATQSSVSNNDNDDPDEPSYYAANSRQRKIIDPNDRRFVTRPSTPYSCGKLLHILCAWVV